MPQEFSEMPMCEKNAVRTHLSRSVVSGSLMSR